MLVVISSLKRMPTSSYIAKLQSKGGGNGYLPHYTSIVITKQRMLLLKALL
jgi:hypothetical protein